MGNEGPTECASSHEQMKLHLGNPRPLCSAGLDIATLLHLQYIIGKQKRGCY